MNYIKGFGCLSTIYSYSIYFCQKIIHRASKVGMENDFDQGAAKKLQTDFLFVLLFWT